MSDPALITAYGVMFVTGLTAIGTFIGLILQSRSTAHKSDVELLRGQLESQIELSKKQASLFQEEREQSAARHVLLQKQQEATQDELTETRELLDKAIRQNFRFKVRINKLEIEIVRLGGKVPPEDPEDAEPITLPGEKR